MTRLRRGSYPFEPVCCWCKQPINTSWDLVAGRESPWPGWSPVRVCSTNCPKRPEGNNDE